MNAIGKIIPLRPDADEAAPGFADAGGVCAAQEPFALMVRGDSMAPEFRDGHIIMVDPTVPPADGCYVVAEHDGGHVFRMLKTRGGRRVLCPLNARYPELALGDEMAVVGVITQRAGRRRREAKQYR